jgi:LmbE family N-acetylglucosaminyl deacetylase
VQLNSLKEITKDSRHIFLSPHLDDVVYSCGGTLGVQASNGLRPLVITVFAGQPAEDWQPGPFAQEVQRRMQASNLNAHDLMALRRREDAKALGVLSSDYLWLDYLDAIYRGSPPYYTSNEELFGGEVHPADTWIDRQLAQDLLEVSERLPDVVWYVPLGIGHHVDHQIVTSAADRLVRRGAKVKFYEDFPYVLKDGALEARLDELGGGMRPAYVEMSEMLPLRIEAANCYASQTSLNFANETAMHRSMKEFTHSIRPVQTVHLERYWTP